MFVHTPDSPTLHDDNGATPLELGGEGKTLHTPELLNSLMTLAPPSFPSSYSQYQEAASGEPGATPSLQQTTSSLIKEGLKVSIRSRRASTGQALFTEERREIKTELTSVDEARRQRRRERNKVAATKCRNKKKIETQHLIVDSERQVNQHNSLRLEIIQLLQERSQLVSALSSHLPCCTSACADSTAAALSRCNHTPPPEVPRPLSPLTPLTSPDSERRPSGSSTCSWSSVGEMALESAACALPFGGGGGFPCGGSVMANPAMTPSPTASVSPGYCAGAGGRPASTSGYGLYSPPGSGASMMLSPPACAAMVAPHSGQGALLSPAGQHQPVKMNMGSPTGAGCAMYGGQGGYMPPPVSQPDGYGYYNCGPVAPAPAQTPYPAGYGPSYGQNYAGYGRMC
ncbi:proto-oncogene c-Fos-like isoform X1 [Amphibalanus amphitrite]|uniref:proto-oncogene c-Fos-like isoform X1 n=2 Tax=Amphibalanus amphitrite TaxID=1232801 RepID=UPI001C8FA7B0|nr:proto-oncogene c-Fos-like isoform X1 [Amphibalanus amphitrite]XP_043190671.1 proto-oncogene c-Fos-like isoform X1 [Amphibalanus amphitrite]